MSEQRFSPLVELTRSRLLSLMREPGVLFWVFIFPVLLAVALGLAFRSRPPETGVVAVAEGPGAQATVEALTSDGRVSASLFAEPEAAEALRVGKVDLVVRAIRGSGSDGAPLYTYRFDPTRPQSLTVRLVVDDALQRSLGRVDLAAVHEEIVTEPGARYIDFLLPGLIGLNLMSSSMWGIGFVLVMSRTRKMLKRLAATPMRRAHYLLATAFSRLFLLALELGLLVVFGTLAFGVKIHGSIVELTLVALLGASAFAGVALLVAARATSVEVASGLMNFVMLPMWVLSGSFFSYSRFPDALQTPIKLLPLTALNDALRAIMNEGAILTGLLPEIATLAAWGTISFLVALKFFKWQ